jgi:catechol 2,3-dioxygenase-like lactoylglutathione lyase family enzyme
MKTLGLRHAALNVKDPQISKRFYVDVLKMQIEWEPDAENVYLTNAGKDNLALHKAPAEIASHGGALDHIGFALPTAETVDEWYHWVVSRGVKIIHEPKTHRDGARSFYMADPDGIVIQMIHHLPIAKEAYRE